MLRILATGALMGLLLSTAAFADGLAAPTGDVVLHVTGKISKTNNGDAADFDMAMLEALAGRTTTTATPWYDAAKTFSGPLGSALLEAVGASGTTLKVLALNDYASEIPVSDFTQYPVILATKLDGEADVDPRQGADLCHLSVRRNAGPQQRDLLWPLGLAGKIDRSGVT